MAKEMTLECQREDLDTALVHALEAEECIQRVANVLEDGGTEWDERVMKVLNALRTATRELAIVKKQFNENNPPEPREPGPGFNGFKFD